MHPAAQSLCDSWASCWKLWPRSWGTNTLLVPQPVSPSPCGCCAYAIVLYHYTNVGHYNHGTQKFRFLLTMTTTSCCLLSNCAHQIFFPASTCDVIIRHAHLLINIIGRTCRPCRTLCMRARLHTSCMQYYASGRLTSLRLFCGTRWIPQQTIGRHCCGRISWRNAVRGARETWVRFAVCRLLPRNWWIPRLCTRKYHTTHMTDVWKVRRLACLWLWQFTVWPFQCISVFTHAYTGIAYMYRVHVRACKHRLCLLRQFSLSACLSVTLELLYPTQTTKHISTGSTAVKLSHLTSTVSTENCLTFMRTLQKVAENKPFVGQSSPIFFGGGGRGCRGPFVVLKFCARSVWTGSVLIRWQWRDSRSTCV